MRRTLIVLTLLNALACGDTQTSKPNNSHNSSTNNTDVDGWTWTPIQNTKCGKGTQAGVGISQGSDQTKLVVYFEGGGACWDAASCHILNAAVNIEKNYGEADFLNTIRPLAEHPLFDRQNGPFGDVPMVFIPYCTGDLHSGNHVGSYDAFNPERKVHHNGGANVALYLEHLKSRYPNVQEIFVIGVSAGGYGAMMNHHRFVQTFPNIPVHVLADGSPLIQPRDGRWAAWNSAWQFEVPPGCTECETSYNAFAKNAIASDAGRISLLTYLDDAVIALYFAYSTGLNTAINEVLQTYDGEWGESASAFYKDGTEHVMLQFYETLEDNQGQSLKAFIEAWIEGT